MTVAVIDRPQPRPRRRLCVAASERTGKTTKSVTVMVTGEVDATNAKEFAVAVCAAGAGASRVTLDVSGLEFMAFDGVAALHAINAHLTRADVPWCVLPGAAVSRVLGLCDPEHVIPVAQPDRRGRRGVLRLVEPA